MNPVSLLVVFALSQAAEPVPAQQRTLLVGMSEIQSRLPDIPFDSAHENVSAKRDDIGGLDLTYSYTPPSRAGAVDWLYHSLMIRRVIPQRPLDDEALGQAARSLSQSKGYSLQRLDVEPLQWTTTTQCFALQRSKTTVGTLCVGERDHAIVLFAVDGLILKEPGSVDALFGERLKNLQRFRL